MNILFLGGDKRMTYAAEYLSSDHHVFFYGESLPVNETFPVVVLPFPLTRDGKTILSPSSPIPFEEVPRFVAPVAPVAPVVLAGGSCPRLAELCAEHSLSLVNYSASETLTLRNAALTAETAVALLAESSDGSLLGSRVLILGYGRIARALAARLTPFGCDITVSARRRETRTEAELNGFTALPLSEIPLADFDYIVNTVPAPLLTAEDFSHIKSGAIFLELATLPNSPPAAHVKYIHGAGLPGRCSPKTAGKYIAEELSRLIQERTEP